MQTCLWILLHEHFPSLFRKDFHTVTKPLGVNDYPRRPPLSPGDYIHEIQYGEQVLAALSRQRACNNALYKFICLLLFLHYLSVVLMLFHCC